MANQLKLFPEDDFVVLETLKLEEAEVIAEEVRANAEACCERLELVRSIRRRKPEVHDVDFVALTSNNTEWFRIVAAKETENENHLLRKISLKSARSFWNRFFPG